MHFFTQLQSTNFNQQITTNAFIGEVESHTHFVRFSTMKNESLIVGQNNKKVSANEEGYTAP